MAKRGAVRRLAGLHGLSRAAIGFGLAVAPDVTARGWIGEAVDTPGGAVAMRAMGVRDMCIGLGQWRAARRGDPIKPWLRYGALSDLVDFGATAAVGAGQLGPMAAPTMGLAASSSVASLGMAALADA
jgi:hypothetical protein